MAESKRRGKNAASEHLDEVFDDAADDAPEDADVLDFDERPSSARRGGAVKAGAAKRGTGAVKAGAVKTGSGAKAENGGRTGTAVRPRSRSEVARTDSDRSVRSRLDDSPGLFDRVGRFFREIVAELRKVIWPTRKELVAYTVVVVVFVAVILSVVGGLDLGFAKAVLYIFSGNK